MDTLILYTSEFPKKRVGKHHDGGYVIVDLPGEYDLFLAGGISGDISFENAILSLFPKLKCLAFDGTIKQLPKNANHSITFVKKNLGSKNTERLTDLQEYMHDANNIFVKIDIEGHEFRLLPTLFTSGYINKIKQLVVEIHSPADIHMYPGYFSGLSDIHNSDMFELFRNLNTTHTLVHFHANNGPKITTIDNIQIPHVFELTYIRNDFVSKKERNTEPLPTSLDMKNITSKPDYNLSGFPYTV
tara:strand:+ start:2834 stop:3565 length:732 start_codon:yes stop_codon:yes gene_type:complete